MIAVKRTPEHCQGLPPAVALGRLASLACSQPSASELMPHEVATALTSAARTATTSSVEIWVPRWARGVMALLQCSAAGAAGSIKPMIMGVWPGTSVDGRICDDTTGLAAVTGSRVLACSESGTLAGFNVSSNSKTWPKIYFRVVHATADSYTYSLEYCFLP